MAKNLITGLDIGTSTIKVVVVENLRGLLELRQVLKFPSAGLRKGAIYDVSELAQSLAPVILEIKKFARAAAKNIYFNINSYQTRVQKSRGIIAVSRADSEISLDDLERVKKAAEAINLGANRLIIHNVTSEYIVDDVEDIADPLGLNGNRLEVESLIVDVFSPHFKNLVKAVELAGGQVGGAVFGPLATSRGVLSRTQKDLGVVLIDMGGGSTGMSIYDEGKLIKAVVFPVGANNISNDIAVGLKVPVEVAEDLKINFGNAASRGVNLKDMIDFKKNQDGVRTPISRRFLAEIIESRLSEIFDLIIDELKSLDKTSLPGGIVLAGGGAKMPGLTELAKQKLRLSSQIGVLNLEEWGKNSFLTFPGAAEDPELANAFGLALTGIDKNFAKPGNFVEFQAKRLLKYFIP